MLISLDRGVLFRMFATLTYGACLSYSQTSCGLDKESIRKTLQLDSAPQVVTRSKGDQRWAVSGEYCVYTIPGGGSLRVDPKSLFDDDETVAQIARTMTRLGSKCESKPTLANGLWCVDPKRYFLFFSHDGEKSRFVFSDWPVSAQATEPQAEALSKLMVAAKPIVPHTALPSPSSPLADEAEKSADRGITLQAGLWKITTSVTPHVKDDQNGGAGGFLANLMRTVKASVVCSSGKPGESIPAIKAGQQGCTISIKSMSSTSSTTDLVCTTSSNSNAGKTIVHSEMKLVDAIHATELSQTTIKVAGGEDMIMDGLQKWLFLNRDCGSLKPGESLDQ